ncbi:hypothetical protein SAMN05443245_3606 [Paraburkholderia fungorum]|uniref:Uncharacterized protein n=1 Tax=Paraburkholderia fungorum TaxID=134537 RepID=A0A1H1H7T0_9BURK|nr:hypothetical protein [Paraburkholderia fungorum]SDR21411.1 hypothetical protein SAMN05443245_3606 [Paraburkholderia fungorum]
MTDLILFPYFPFWERLASKGARAFSTLQASTEHSFAILNGAQPDSAGCAAWSGDAARRISRPV